MFSMKRSSLPKSEKMTTGVNAVNTAAAVFYTMLHLLVQGSIAGGV
jgi:hypothetical protein